MKRIFILISILGISLVVHAQFLNSPSLQLIEKAIREGVFCIEKGYQIQDSNLNAFGRNNKEEFSSFYSLGIKTNKGYILSHQAIYPWLFDKDFEEYKDFNDHVLYEIIKMAAQMYLENQSDDRYKTITQEVLTQE